MEKLWAKLPVQIPHTEKSLDDAVVIDLGSFQLPMGAADGFWDTEKICIEIFNIARNNEDILWAAENSCDGIYYHSVQMQRVDQFDVTFLCYYMVLLRPEDATFFKLKYSKPLHY